MLWIQRHNASPIAVSHSSYCGTCLVRTPAIVFESYMRFNSIFHVAYVTEMAISLLWLHTIVIFENRYYWWDLPSICIRGCLYLNVWLYIWAFSIRNCYRTATIYYASDKTLSMKCKQSIEFLVPIFKNDYIQWLYVTAQDRFNSDK